VSSSWKRCVADEAVRLDTDSILPWLLAVANNAIRKCRPVNLRVTTPLGQAAPAAQCGYLWG